MPQPNDLSRSRASFEQDATIVAVIEMSQSSWLIAGTVPGIERQPLKKIVPDAVALLRLLQRWRDEATRGGRCVARIAVAFEAGRDGFWLARWLMRHEIEIHVIHPTSVAVSREHRRAKTDRLDTAMLMRVFLGWLRGERGHCGMVAVPTPRGRGRQAPKPRAGESGRRTYANRQSHEGGVGPARHPRLQAGAAQGSAATGVAAHAGGVADSA